MTSVILWLTSLLIVAYIFIKKPTIVKLYLLSWAVLVLNVCLGPLSYPQANISIDAITLFILTILSFVTGYYFTKLLFDANVASDISQRSEIAFNKLGAIFALSWVVGGLIYATPFLIALDIPGLRNSINEGERDVPIFLQIGAVFSGFSWLIISRIAIDRGVYKPCLAIVTMLSLVAIPILSAGRQIYLQLIFLIAVGQFLSVRYKISRPIYLIDLRRILFTILLLSTASIIIITLLRFADDSIVYLTKVDQFRAVSNAELRMSYNSIVEGIPHWIFNTLVEFDYYFSAQLINLLEQSSSLAYTLLDIRILEKIPFVHRNFEKICAVFDLTCFEKNHYSHTGSISEFAWGTVYSTNFRLFGVLGTQFINMFFGAVCSISQSAFSNNPRNYIAYNFYMANCLVAFYSVIDSAFTEIYIVVYYLISTILFILQVRLYIKPKRVAGSILDKKL